VKQRILNLILFVVPIGLIIYGVLHFSPSPPPTGYQAEGMVSNSVFIFTATTVLIGLDYLLLAANWRVVKALLETLPENQRRVRYSKEDTKDPLIRDKHFVLFIHFMGCVWFGISILTCAVALLGISFAAARVWVGGQQMTNYYQSIWFLLAGILSFGLGLFFVGILHVGDALCVLLGKPNRIVDKLPIP